LENNCVEVIQNDMPARKVKGLMMVVVVMTHGENVLFNTETTTEKKTAISIS
jgi:hypothetical protein